MIENLVFTWKSSLMEIVSLWRYEQTDAALSIRLPLTSFHARVYSNERLPKTLTRSQGPVYEPGHRAICSRTTRQFRGLLA